MTIDKIVIDKQYKIWILRIVWRMANVFPFEYIARRIRVRDYYLKNITLNVKYKMDAELYSATKDNLLNKEDGK